MSASTDNRPPDSKTILDLTLYRKSRPQNYFLASQRPGPTQLGIDLSRPILEHGIRLHGALVNELMRRLYAGDRQLELEFLPGRRTATVNLVGERQELRQEAKLAQRGSLVPGNVLVVEMVAPYVHDTRKGDREMLSSWRNTGKPAFEVRSTLFTCFVLGDPYSQSMTLLWVHLKTNSSITRSIPTVRLTSSSSVSSGLLKMKWSL